MTPSNGLHLAQINFNKRKHSLPRITSSLVHICQTNITIHTDALDVQLGAVIMQEGKTLYFYSKKLSKAQINYTITEKELLSIVKTLKYFQNILSGHDI